MCSLLVSSPEKDYFREDINERSLTHFLLSLIAWFLLNVLILGRVKPTQNTLCLIVWCWKLSLGQCRVACVGIWCRGVSRCLSARWGDQLLWWHEQQGQPEAGGWCALQRALLWQSQSPHRLHPQPLRHRLAENQGKAATRIPSFPPTMPGHLFLHVNNTFSNEFLTALSMWNILRARLIWFCNDSMGT